MSTTSDTLSAIGLVVSMLTFGITSLLTYYYYYSSEWRKVMEEVNISSTYDEAQEAATELYRLVKTLNNLQVSRERCDEERCRRHLPSNLDYADIFFLHGRGLLSGADIEPHCRDIEAYRRKAQKAWHVIVGKYDSYQVLHHRNSFVRALRWLVGLPNQPFFSKKWVGRGQRHMKVVEPLDVANYYILNTEHTDYGAPQDDIRPPCYVVLQQETQRVFNNKDWGNMYQRELESRVNRYRTVAKLVEGCEVEGCEWQNLVDAPLPRSYKIELRWGRFVCALALGIGVTVAVASTVLILLRARRFGPATSRPGNAAASSYHLAPAPSRHAHMELDVRRGGHVDPGGVLCSATSPSGVDGGAGAAVYGAGGGDGGDASSAYGGHITTELGSPLTAGISGAAITHTAHMRLRRPSAVVGDVLPTLITLLIAICIVVAAILWNRWRPCLGRHHVLHVLGFVFCGSAAYTSVAKFHESDDYVELSTALMLTAAVPIVITFICMNLSSPWELTREARAGIQNSHEKIAVLQHHPGASNTRREVLVEAGKKRDPFLSCVATRWSLAWIIVHHLALLVVWYKMDGRGGWLHQRHTPQLEIALAMALGSSTASWLGLHIYLSAPIRRITRECLWRVEGMSRRLNAMSAELNQPELLPSDDPLAFSIRALWAWLAIRKSIQSDYNVPELSVLQPVVVVLMCCGVVMVPLIIGLVCSHPHLTICMLIAIIVCASLGVWCMLAAGVLVHDVVLLTDPTQGDVGTLELMLESIEGPDITRLQKVLEKVVEFLKKPDWTPTMFGVAVDRTLLNKIMSSVLVTSVINVVSAPIKKALQR